MTAPPETDEFSLIARHFAPLASDAGALGLTDDAAVIDIPEGHQLVATKDAMVEGVHYLPDTAPGDIARKLLRVNLSDLAAMGAAPVGVLLACAFPKATRDEWIAEFAAGLGADLSEFNTGLLGGDTVSTGGLAVFSLTALGTVPKGEALTRGGAHPGDLVYVSGTLGDAAAGLGVLTKDLAGIEGADALAARHRHPIPRLALGQALRGIAGAAIDVSDGLMADAGHIADVSGVAIEIMAHKVPVSEPLAALIADDQALIALALAGGDDYELLFTAPAGRAEAVAAATKAAGIAVSEIGTVLAGKGITARDRDGAPVEIASPGWRHF